MLCTPIPMITLITLLPSSINPTLVWKGSLRNVYDTAGKQCRPKVDDKILVCSRGVISCSNLRITQLLTFIHRESIDIIIFITHLIIIIKSFLVVLFFRDCVFQLVVSLYALGFKYISWKGGFVYLLLCSVMVFANNRVHHGPMAVLVIFLN